VRALLRRPLFGNDNRGVMWWALLTEKASLSWQKHNLQQRRNAAATCSHLFSHRPTARAGRVSTARA